ncbi:hypothetical protein PENTCL1PPCAC_24244 [Pristionchus entomophagus]|uniref:Uncharacterized protein n=1 Tax=Pristionchus entomophagus TaxID=358040 RepID=A0AAV5U5C5_9BILA|nr:hypothetical protein PENTCL1PPCAC_24244 [Pristionchus entomophagus]
MKSKKKGGEPQKKLKSKSRTPSSRNTTDTSQQVTRPLVPPANANEGPSKAGVPPPPATGSAPSNPATVPLMRDNNEMPTGLIPSQNGPFIPGEKPFKIPAKHFKWMGPMRRKTRWHGDPVHEFEGVEGDRRNWNESISIPMQILPRRLDPARLLRMLDLPLIRIDLEENG